MQNFAHWTPKPSEKGPKDFGRTKRLSQPFPHLCPTQIFGQVYGGGIEGEGETAWECTCGNGISRPISPLAPAPVKGRGSRPRCARTAEMRFFIAASAKFSV